MKFLSRILLTAVLLSAVLGCKNKFGQFKAEKDPVEPIDTAVQATVSDKLDWALSPTLMPEAIEPVFTYGSNQIAAVGGVKFTRDGLCGILDYGGNIVIEAKYGDIFVLGDVYLCLHTGQSPSVGNPDCFDIFTYARRDTVPTVEEGKVPMQAVYAESSFCPVFTGADAEPAPHLEGGVFFVEKGEIYSGENGENSVKGTGKFALWSEDKLLGGFEYEDGYFCANGLLAAKKNGKWGYLNKAGENVIPFAYDAAYLQHGKEIPYPLFCGFIPVCRDGLWGYLASDGREVIPCVLEGALPVSAAGLAFAKQDGKWGVLRVSSFAMGSAAGYDYPPVLSAKQVLTVTLDSGELNMRKSCRADSVVVGTLQNGQEVCVFSEGGRISAADTHNWLFCGAKDANGKWIFGYCYGQFLRENNVGESGT